ncbi:MULTISPECIES: hypothetical protein [Ralstonia]|uniref:hypothetical protein n=1 Tax=Ralstonia TaxID=48736 RepID=UPI0018EA7BF7|nr:MULTISPECIES: hypothetical protein [unclassified Ralstonia]
MAANAFAGRICAALSMAITKIGATLLNQNTGFLLATRNTSQNKTTERRKAWATLNVESVIREYRQHPSRIDQEIRRHLKILDFLICDTPDAFTITPAGGGIGMGHRHW